MRYNPYYLEPEVRKEAYNIPENELTVEEKEERELKAVRPIKAAPPGLTSSVFSDPMMRYGIQLSQKRTGLKCLHRPLVSESHSQRVLVCHYLNWQPIQPEEPR